MGEPCHECDGYTSIIIDGKEVDCLVELQAALAENARLRALIGQVLDCPIHHRGSRSAANSVEPYVAKRIDDSLLDALEQAANQ